MSWLTEYVDGLEDGVSEPADLCATVYHCLGIDLRAEMTDQTGKPVPLTRGQPIQELF